MIPQNILDLTPECRHYLVLDFAGYVVEFRTNNRTLTNELVRYYQHFVAASSSTPAADCVVHGIQCPVPDIDGDWQTKVPEPGKTRIKEEVLALEDGNKIVRKIQTGVHLLFVGDLRIVAGPLDRYPNQVINFINNMHLEHLLRDDGQLFHAAGACRGAIGCGMAGQSGMGKSTLALRLLGRGLDLVSNDRLVVTGDSNGLMMQGIGKYPRVNPGTVMNQPELLNLMTQEDLARYRSMSPDELWNLEEKYDAFIEPAFGCEFRLAARMSLFVAINWDRHATARPVLERSDPAAHPELIASVMKAPGVMLPRASARIPHPLPEAYMALLSRCEFYVLSGGVDFDVAADEICRRLDAIEF